MKNCISLIGMPGAGKSTLGIVLAKALAKDFVDTDLLIQQSVGCTLQEYLDTHDYLALREVESKLLLTHDFKNAIIATGGSAVYSSEAMARLGTLGPRVYLKASVETILARVNNQATRGIAAAPGTTLNALFLERAPLYESAADKIVEVDQKTFEQSVDAVLKSLTPNT